MTSSSILTTFQAQAPCLRSTLQDSTLTDFFSCADKCEFHVTSCEYLRYMPVTWRPHHGPVQSSNHPRLASTRKSRIFNLSSALPISTVVSFTDIPKSQFHLHVLPARVPLGICSDECHSAFEALKKGFHHSSGPYPLDPGCSNHSPRLMPLTMHWLAVLSIMTPNGDLHPIAFHSRTFSAWNSTTMSTTKSYLQFLKAFKQWRHYLKGSGLPINVVTDHWNLQYFSNDQNPHMSNKHIVSEYLSGFKPGNLFLSWKTWNQTWCTH